MSSTRLPATAATVTSATPDSACTGFESTSPANRVQRCDTIEVALARFDDRIAITVGVLRRGSDGFKFLVRPWNARCGILLRSRHRSIPE